MKPLPLPVRLAAGLAATAVERARDLPRRIIGLPVTIASQALQASMRVQQQVTELAVKGDEALALLRPVEESPEWATFDEDVDPIAPPAAADPRRPAFDRVTDDDLDDLDDLEDELDAGFDDGFDLDDLDDESDEDGSAVDTAVATSTADPTAGVAVDGDAEVDVADDPAAEAAAEEAAEEAALEAEATGADPWEQEQKAIANAPAAVPNYDELSLPQLRARLRTFSVADLEELLSYERSGENRASFVGMLTRRIETVRDQQ
ncbi:lipid droplet-associated protein [Actinokineospora sp. PR83]|uniref:lipid droplet-associated protein n=1 Tax=Actinokineospora sp. PR83 TaxID=2884908 RepID=UPI001F46BCB3|nr:lipid droplet-associated protein [Actinokineospora sp. PR83]MCG8919966.1 lipid droplet-associated protein [Actinokineospora sp. PR83]